jgi:hypothetical protein
MKRILPLILLVATALSAGCNGKPTPPEASYSLRTPVKRDVWQLANGSGAVLQTRRYHIFTTVRRDRLLEKVPGFMEASYANYLRLTGLEERPVHEPMTVYLMATRSQWANLTEHVIGRRIPLEAGGYCYEKTCFFWDIGVRGTLSVAAHEGLHQFFRHQLTDQLPLWLEEGLCTTAEGFEIHAGRVVFTQDRNVERFNAARQAMTRKYWLDLPVLLRRHSQEAVSTHHTAKAVGYYGQLWALVQYIRSIPRYRQGMQQLVRDARAGVLHTKLGMTRRGLRQLRRNALVYNRTVAVPLFRAYVEEDLDAFEEGYRAYTRELTMIE